MKRSRILAAIMAFMGGSMGLHKFYLREVSGGIFYIFMLFMIVPAIKIPITTILGFIEGFKLLSMSDDQFDRKYNNVPQNSPYRRRQTRKAPAVPVSDRSSRKRANPFIKSGDRLYKEYELEEAATDYAKALEISPDNKDVLFNMAAVQSLLENKESSLKHLDQLVKYGFKDFEKIQKHDDLAFLRIQPEFEAFKAAGYKLSTTAKKSQTPPEDDLLQNDALLSQLNKLVELRKKGLLSEQEFSVERKRLLRR